MHPDVVLERFDESDQGVFGYVWTRGPRFFSGECPARDNRPLVSCILPVGIHRVAWILSPRLHRATYRVLDCPGRDGILLHPANLMGDSAKGYACQLLGCIALGERLGWIEQQKAVLFSAPAIRRFEAFMGRAPFILEIR